MKKRLFKHLAALLLVVLTAYSCTSTSDNTLAETEPLDNTAVVDSDVDRMSNETAEYDDMFDNVENTEQYTVLELARLNPDLSTFVMLVDMSGLAPSLKMVDPVTVFMPTNAAFAELPAERLEELKRPENKTELLRLVQAHVLPQRVPYMEFNTGQIIETEGGNEVAISSAMDGNAKWVGGAKIVKPDVEASNGLIHVVSRVIQPELSTERINE